ncbi:hypothetical protein [Streptomyces halstedii]|uniref:hypothetical protein n=1 Tax=Streptomyces halstedii TaxID=1944 RepID=UPI0033A41A72
MAMLALEPVAVPTADQIDAPAPPRTPALSELSLGGLVSAVGELSDAAFGEVARPPSNSRFTSDAAPWNVNRLKQWRGIAT